MRPYQGQWPNKGKGHDQEEGGATEGHQLVERLSRVLGLSIGVMKTMTFAEERADFIWYFQVTLYH